MIIGYIIGYGWVSFGEIQIWDGDWFWGAGAVLIGLGVLWMTVMY